MGGKGPLLLAFSAFVLTFLLTRTITRLIRAGRGPFHNISKGGTHLHHSTPGIILLVTGAFLAVGQQAHRPLNYLAALLVGVGASLVLDEFAMIFQLQDVYWSQEGQLSVSVVTLAGALVGLAVVGVSPAQVPHLDTHVELIRLIVTFGLLFHLVFVAVTVLKGKYVMAMLGIFVSPLVWAGAVRMARPTSIWSRRLYSPRRKAIAAARAKKFDERWGPIRTKWNDFIGGAPSLPKDRKSVV